jgi:hypothetical protein
MPARRLRRTARDRRDSWIHGGRRSTWFAQIIAGTCASYPDCVFVEIGVENAYTLRVVAPRCAEVHGCDVTDCREALPAGARFWHMSSDRFFAEYDGSTPHVVFIDGGHSHEQAKRDFENAFDVTVPGGAVFIHDTWPREDADHEPGRCGTVYRLREELERGEHQVFTWTRFPGLTVVAKPTR